MAALGLSGTSMQFGQRATVCAMDEETVDVHPGHGDQYDETYNSYPHEDIVHCEWKHRRVFYYLNTRGSQGVDLNMKKSGAVFSTAPLFSYEYQSLFR